MHSFQIVIPQFLPPVSFFLPFLKSRTIIIADHIQYTKRSHLTRRHIKKDLLLTIPVKRGHTKAIFQKEIAYDENWQRKHLTRLHHTYHMSPFFEDYIYRLQDLYKKQHKYLSGFLFDQIQLLTSLLKIECHFKLSSKEGFDDLLEESLIRFAKNNSKYTFLYNTGDVNKGFINPVKLTRAQIQTRPLPNAASLFTHTNILEFFFNYGPEAPFKIR